MQATQGKMQRGARREEQLSQTRVRRAEHFNPILGPELAVIYPPVSAGEPGLQLLRLSTYASNTWQVALSRSAIFAANRWFAPERGGDGSRVATTTSNTREARQP